MGTCGRLWEITVSSHTSMFIGEYKHTLDEKSRVSVPVKLREELGKTMVITHGLNNCLTIYPMPEWREVALKLSRLSMGDPNTRGFSRFMLAGAVEVTADSIGRILIPDFLKQYAQLGDKVVLAGVYDRIEVWNEDAWTAYKTEMQQNADAMAAKLGESGVF